jgi:hypothetical protein
MEQKMLTKSLKFLPILVAITFISSISHAGCTTKYDYNSGNYYTVCPNSTGTSINGYNTNNGTTWSQQQNSNGTYSGRDGSGNLYSGDNNTGYYLNYGTGETCFGTGALRTCY